VPVCVIVLEKADTAIQLQEMLGKIIPNLLQLELIQPINTKVTSKERTTTFEKVSLLNPKISKRLRQKTMALWLMPFGFITGISFSKMTGLQTFGELGVNSLGELFLGGLLGMGAGLIGSFFAATSVNSDKNDDVGFLRKLSEGGKWLLLVETPMEVELPWQVIQKSQPKEIITLRDL